jgi:peflin
MLQARIHILIVLPGRVGLKGSAPENRAPAYPGARAPSPGITFDRFVRACVVVKQITESFARIDTDHDGWIQINYDQFMSTVLALP